MSTLSLRQQQTILDRYQTVTPHLIDSIQRSHHNDDSNRRGFHLLLSSNRFLLIDPSIDLISFIGLIPSNPIGFIRRSNLALYERLSEMP